MAEGKLTRQDVRDWANKRGWVKDGRGYWHKNIGGTPFRLKIGERSVRFDRQVRYTGESANHRAKKTDWVRASSGPYKNLRITMDGRLAGLSK